MTLPRPAAPTIQPMQDAATLDPIEREERELAARRAQFLAGAQEDFESLDWSATADGSDDEYEPAAAGGDDFELDAAAARVLDAVRGDSLRCEEEDEQPAEPKWEELPDYVPPGHEGFNEFARAQMRKAGVPSNDRVLPASDLMPGAVGLPAKQAKAAALSGDRRVHVPPTKPHQPENARGAPHGRRQDGDDDPDRG